MEKLEKQKYLTVLDINMIDSLIEFLEAQYQLMGSKNSYDAI